MVYTGCHESAAVLWSNGLNKQEDIPSFYHSVMGHFIMTSDSVFNTQRHFLWYYLGWFHLKASFQFLVKVIRYMTRENMLIPNGLLWVFFTSHFPLCSKNTFWSKWLWIIFLSWSIKGDCVVAAYCAWMFYKPHSWLLNS